MCRQGTVVTVQFIQPVFDQAEMTRFIIAGISVTQVIYLSEIGALLLRSSIETSVGQLAGIFLVRTVLALPLFVILGHLFLD